jgi:signal transduction histidine kinase
MDAVRLARILTVASGMAYHIVRALTAAASVAPVAPMASASSTIPLSALPVAAVVVDYQHRILETNARFTALCHRSDRDLVSTQFDDLMAIEYREVARTRINRLFMAAEGDVDEFGVRLAPANDRWVDVTATRLGTGPAPASVFVAVETIGRGHATHNRAIPRLGIGRRSSDGEPRTARPKRLRKPPLEDIVAAASHELRQPLQSIIGWVRIARSAAARPDLLTRAMASIERNALFADRIADDLLACTPYARRAVRALEPVDISRVVEESVESLRPSADAASVKLSAHTPGGPIAVQGDRAGLHHVMMNLLANAIRATPARGAVEVNLQLDNGVVRLEVSDTGHGIAQDQLADLFRPFGPRHGTSRGLGVGLAIVREWVELLGGTIRAESDGPERGARFVVALPLHTTH